MARYSLYFKKSVSKDLRAIPKQDVRRILKRIDMLADDPRPAGSEKLSTQELYRIRVSPEHREAMSFSERTGSIEPVRVVLEIQDAVLIVIVVKVGKRSDVYR